MNGRIYDPTLGRFLQADPFIQAPTNSQSYNRYSYVFNNPLSNTDPTGYFSIKQVFGIIVAAIGTYICGGNLECGKAGYALVGALAGATTAAVNGGNVIKGAFMGAFSSLAFGAIGDHFQGLENANFRQLTANQALGKIAAHAITGGVISVLQGGKFGHGFAAAGYTQAFSKAIGQLQTSTARIASAALLGGTVSRITGGKFANGAITAAFSRAFNDDIHSSRAEKAIAAAGVGKKYVKRFSKLLKAIDSVRVNIVKTEDHLKMLEGLTYDELDTLSQTPMYGNSKNRAGWAGGNKDLMVYAMHEYYRQPIFRQQIALAGQAATLAQKALYISPLASGIVGGMPKWFQKSYGYYSDKNFAKDLFKGN